MARSKTSAQHMMEAPVGWWRCTYSAGGPCFGKFQVGTLYPCVQNGPSLDIHKKLIPRHRLSYRIYPDPKNMAEAQWSPYWEFNRQKFCYAKNELEFEFVRRFTPDEQKELLAHGCRKDAFSAMRSKKPKLSLGDAFLNWFVGNKAPKPQEAGRKPEAPLRYYFEYKSTAEGKRAVVFKRTHEWGIAEVGAFKYGVDAQEYVDIKNVQLRRQNA